MKYFGEWRFRPRSRPGNQNSIGRGSARIPGIRGPASGPLRPLLGLNRGLAPAVETASTMTRSGSPEAVESETVAGGKGVGDSIVAGQTGSRGAEPTPRFYPIHRRKSRTTWPGIPRRKAHQVFAGRGIRQHRYMVRRIFKPARALPIKVPEIFDRPNFRRR